MRTVFLSYSQNNLPKLGFIARLIESMGASVWWDQKDLHAGDRWPKVLGEAIAGSDFVVLVWSGEAALSNMVELEWCTALALGKPILTCRLDDTPLPRSLVAVQAVPYDAIESAIQRMLGEPIDSSNSGKDPQTDRILKRLSEIDGNEPEKALEQAKSALRQDHFTNYGTVVQTTGDVHIGSQNPRPTPNLKKTRLKNTHLVLLILLTSVMIVGAIVKLIPRHGDKTPSAPPPVEQSVIGFVSDQAAEPIEDVTVTLLIEDSKLTSYTDKVGRFSFKVSGKPQDQVVVFAQKGGYQPEKRYVLLGGSLSFKMRRRLE